MPELRTRYMTRLRAQSGELLDFISRCERGKLTADACDEVRTLAHSLCGSGTTFGFPEISGAARYLEEAIDCGPPHNPQTYMQLALKLVRACDPAIKTPDEAPWSEFEDPAPEPAEVEHPLLLVVSDDRNMVSVMNQMFGTRMDVVGTADHDEALNLVKFGNPATIIFDMNEVGSATSLEKLYAQAHKQNIVMIAIAPNRQAAAAVHAISAVPCNAYQSHCQSKPSIIPPKPRSSAGAGWCWSAMTTSSCAK